MSLDFAVDVFRSEGSNSTLSRFIPKFENSGVSSWDLINLLYFRIYQNSNAATISYLRSLGNNGIANIDDETFDELLEALLDLDQQKSSLINTFASNHVADFRRPPLDNLPNLPMTQIPNGAFIDLASGPDFLNYFPQFQSDTHYYAIDKSYFVYASLFHAASNEKITNFTPINKSLADFQIADVPESITGLRIKNIRSYVDNHLEISLKFTQSVASGGMISIQDYATAYSYSDFILFYKPLIEATKVESVTLSEGDPGNRFSVHRFEVIKK